MYSPSSNPFGGGNDYFRPEDFRRVYEEKNRGGHFRPEDLRRAYEQKNPGKNFQDFLNQAENKYGKGSMDPVRRGLSDSNKTEAKAPAKPAAKTPPKPAAKTPPKPAAKTPPKPAAKTPPKPAPKKK